MSLRDSEPLLKKLQIFSEGLDRFSLSHPVYCKCQRVYLSSVVGCLCLHRVFSLPFSSASSTERCVEPFFFSSVLVLVPPCIVPGRNWCGKLCTNSRIILASSSYIYYSDCKGVVSWIIVTSRVNQLQIVSSCNIILMKF